MNNNLQPHLLCGPGQVAPYVLLPGDPGRVDRIAAGLDSFKQVACNREFKTVTGTYEGTRVSAVSTGIGGPSAAIAVEELARLGAEAVIRVGSCGGWLPEMSIGDLVIPVGVVRNEGTSKTYAPENWPAVPDFDVYSALVRAAGEQGRRFHTGITICRDNFYLFEGTTEAFVKRWRPFCVIASEMEASTVLTVARLRGVKAGGIFTVVNRTSDRGFQKDRGVREYALQARDGSRGEALAGEQRAIQTALEALHYLQRQKTT